MNRDWVCHQSLTRTICTTKRRDVLVENSAAADSIPVDFRDTVCRTPLHQDHDQAQDGAESIQLAVARPAPHRDSTSIWFGKPLAVDDIFIHFSHPGC